MTTQKFLIKIASVLERLDIDYAISGGIAVSVWGRPRYTADIDIVVNIKSAQSVEDLVKLLSKEFKKAYSDKDLALDAFNRKGEFNIIEPEYGLKADFFIVPQEEFKLLEIKRAKKRKIGEKYINFISPEDLIISKLLWFREGQSTRQLEDIASVIDVQTDLDKAYLKKWVKKLDLEKEWKEFKKLK